LKTGQSDSPAVPKNINLDIYDSAQQNRHGHSQLSKVGP
jgi:hypothetical protein